MIAVIKQDGQEIARLTIDIQYATNINQKIFTNKLVTEQIEVDVPDRDLFINNGGLLAFVLTKMRKHAKA
jgi:hypothetical protein